MASATKTTKARGGGEGGELLKGSSLPRSVKKVTMFINAVREAPEEWKTALIADIEECHGCTAFALNKTTTRAMVDAMGDDYETWGGWEVTLEKVRVNNPSTGKMQDGLAFSSAKKTKRKPRPVANDDVPF